MPRWKWFQRRNQPVDATGPATVYAAHRGAHAPGAPAAEKPKWNAYTEINGLPLITSGQRNQYGIRQRPASLS